MALSSKFKNLSTPKKVISIIISTIVLLLAISGVAYAIAPRDFLQLILTDSAYTKAMLAKNLTTYYPAGEKIVKEINEKRLGFEAKGTIKTEFDENAFSSKEATQDIENYVNSLKVNSSLYINGMLAKGICTLSDNDGAVLTAEAIAEPSNIYANLKELNLGYMSMLKNSKIQQQDVGTLNQTYNNIMTQKADDDLRDAIYSAADTTVNTFDKTTISVIQNKSLEVGSVIATGDVSTIVMSKEDFENTVNTTYNKVIEDQSTFKSLNSCLPKNYQMTYEEFKNKAFDLKNQILQKVDDSGVTNVTLEFYVNKRNKIVGMDIELLSPNNNIGICIITKDDHDRGFAINIKEKTENIILIDIIKNDKASGNINYYHKTEDGPLSIKAKYSDFKLSNDTLYGRITTDSFTLPSKKNLGPINIDVIADGNDDNLTINSTITIKDLVNAKLLLTANKSEYKSFNLPKSAEISPYNDEIVKTAAAKYFLSDLPKTHPEFAKVYKSILVSSINGSIDFLIGGITNSDNPISNIIGSIINGDNLTDAVTGIVDSAMNNDPSKVNGIIDSFLSAFGFEKD